MMKARVLALSLSVLPLAATFIVPRCKSRWPSARSGCCLPIKMSASDSRRR